MLIFVFNSKSTVNMDVATCCLVILALTGSSCGTVVDLTHVYGEDVLYPPVGPNGTSKMYNFTIMTRGYAELTHSW